MEVSCPIQMKTPAGIALKTGTEKDRLSFFHNNCMSKYGQATFATNLNVGDSLDLGGFHTFTMNWKKSPSTNFEQQ
eukprot:8188570-Ditylum_brightwellii.AAC.1